MLPIPNENELDPNGPPVILTDTIPTEIIAGQRDRKARHVMLEISQPKLIGSGTFGSVFLANMAVTGEPLAIKTIYKDANFRFRELNFLRRLDHPNIIYMKYYFNTMNKRREEYINFVTEYMPKSLYQLLCGYRRTHQNLPKFHVKLYIFQVCRALNYLHTQGICHRDIKTQNILVEPATDVVKLCDFGSAKQIHLNEPNATYICSRFYRAPELLLNYPNYTTAIDIWSIGICLIELLTGETPFNGECDHKQLIAIAQILPAHVSSAAIKLLKSILQYDWLSRPTAIEVCASEFMDDLRNEKISRSLPPGTFAWKQMELELRPDLISKVRLYPFEGSFQKCSECSNANKEGLGSTTSINLHRLSILCTNKNCLDTFKRHLFVLYSV